MAIFTPSEACVTQTEGTKENLQANPEGIGPATTWVWNPPFVKTVGLNLQIWGVEPVPMKKYVKQLKERSHEIWKREISGSLLYKNPTVNQTRI